MILEKWKNAQAYVIGKYHIANNLPCQDRTYYYEEHGVKVMALADGAGSQPHSEIGAELVCKEVCNLLTNNFIEYLMFFEYEKVNSSKHILKMKELKKIIIDHIVYKLKDKAILMNIPLKALSSTLLFFAIKDNHYIFGHIGDGIRPSERRKGYATAMIGLALKEAKKLGIRRVLMVCDKDNIGSAKSIINNGGILENEVEVDGIVEQ
jgi:hypothetical protein